jgi:hypothetical protein
VLALFGDYLVGEDLEAAVPSDFGYFVALDEKLFGEEAVVFVDCYFHEFAVDVLFAERVEVGLMVDFWLINVIFRLDLSLK